MKKTVRLMMILAVVLLCLSLTACGSTKAELSPYLSVSYTGYNGNGTAHVDFDFADFEYSIMSQWQDQDKLEKLSELTAVEMTITYSADVSQGLRNGDTVTVTICLDEELAKEYGYTFTGLEKKFTVEGLVEPIEIDPFSEEIFGSGKLVDVTLEGIDPFVCLFLYNNAELSDPIRHITYKFDKDWNLKNGDIITVTASLDENFQKQGYVLTRTEYTITVQGFDRYASMPSDLYADILGNISDHAYQECVNRCSVDIYDGSNNYTPWGASIDNIHVADTALLAVNNQLETEYSFLLVPVYKTITTNEWYDMSTNANISKTWENVVGYYKFTDVIVHPDGTVSYNESYVDLNGNYTDSNAADMLYLDYLREGYTFIEIPMP